MESSCKRWSFDRRCCQSRPPNRLENSPIPSMPEPSNAASRTNVGERPNSLCAIVATATAIAAAIPKNAQSFPITGYYNGAEFAAIQQKTRPTPRTFSHDQVRSVAIRRFRPIVRALTPFCSQGTNRNRANQRGAIPNKSWFDRFIALCPVRDRGPRKER